MKKLETIILEQLSKDDKRNLFNYIISNMEFLSDTDLQDIEDIVKNGSNKMSHINTEFKAALETGISIIDKYSGKEIKLDPRFAGDDRILKTIISVCTSLGIKKDLLTILKNPSFQLPWSNITGGKNLNSGNLISVLNNIKPINDKNLQDIYISKILDNYSIETLFNITDKNKKDISIGKGEVLLKLILKNIVSNGSGDITLKDDSGNPIEIELKCDSGKLASQQQVETKKANMDFVSKILSHFDIKQSDINLLVKKVSNIKTKKDGTQTEAAGPLGGYTNMLTCYDVLFDYINPSNIAEYNMVFLKSMNSVLCEIYNAWKNIKLNEFNGENSDFLKSVNAYINKNDKFNKSDIIDIYNHMCISACMNYKSTYDYLLIFNSKTKNYCSIARSVSHNEIYNLYKTNKIKFEGGYSMSTKAGVRAATPKIYCY